ncbi:MAG TPA: family 10 glycosylhydrolase, partial [Planctomycetota bacterium]|nr:family 10 glycosylhydrolase [Planctomycetota bacterium]
PFGIARPGVPEGIKAGIDQYAQLYADVRKWLREGWLDYLTPQLYWPIDQEAQSFAVLLPWWHAQNVQKRHLWPGINPGRMLQQKPPWRPKELADQISLIRAAGGTTPGHVHFSFKALRTNAAHVGGDLVDRIYREPVLAPAMPWLGATRPRAPVARLEAGDPRTVRWTPDPDTRFVAVQVRLANGWRTHAIVGAATGRCALPAEALSVAVTAVSRTGIASTAAMLR